MPVKILQNLAEAPIRADVLLASAYPEYSRSALAKLFTADKVKVNELPIRAGYKVKPNTEMSADISILKKQADIIDLPVIFEDENIIVVDKPIGVISHARGKYWDEASVASFVRSKISGMEGERAGIVHRLDRATSGVMICAKNQNTLSFLQKQFSHHKTKKVYVAVINGSLEPKEAIIDVPVGRNPKKPQTFRPDPNGKSASTAYKIINSNSTYSLLELKPATGRTHQIRVHLKYLKHPILGDELYGGKPANRLYLHAKSLEITVPGGKRVAFTSKLPDDFLKVIK
jgi:23S rRNA pseudouridine1911/1915/1917 synthase